MYLPYLTYGHLASHSGRLGACDRDDFALTDKAKDKCDRICDRICRRP